MDLKTYSTGIQHVGIPTNDIEATKEFYKKLKKCAEARNVTVASYIKEAIAQRMDNERG